MSDEEILKNRDRLPEEQPKSQTWEHPNGRNEKHAKPVDVDGLTKAIRDAEWKLATLRAECGPKREKRYWESQIRHFRRKLGERGTEDSRIGKCQNQRAF